VSGFSFWVLGVRGSREEALQYVINRNLNRRHLTSDQRGIVASKARNIAEAFEKQAEENRLANLKQNQDTPTGNLLPVEKSPKSQKEWDKSRSTGSK
jgi:hypothetical protein